MGKGVTSHAPAAVASLQCVRALPVALALLFSFHGLAAQDRIDPAGMGQARASVATSRGLGAIASNPGALDLDPVSSVTLNQPVTFSVYTGGGSIGSTYLSAADYKQVFGNPGSISNEERQKIGALLQDKKLIANGAIDLFSLRWRTPGSGTIALHYGHRAFARVNFPEDFATLVASSNISGKDYQLTNRGIGGDWATELGLSFGKSFVADNAAKWFPAIGIGATGKLMRGVAHFDIGENSILTIDQVNINGNLGFLVRGGYEFRSSVPDGFLPQNAVGDFLKGLFPATAGSGIGADVGMSAVIYRAAPGRDAVYFGIAVQDIGSITWSRNTKLRAISNIRDTLTSANLSNVEFTKYQGTLTSIPEFTTSLPTTLRAGFGVKLNELLGNGETTGATPPSDGESNDMAKARNPGTVLSFETEFPLNRIPGNAVHARFSLGADCQISPRLALRTGLSVGNGTGSSVGLGVGVGIRPFNWLSLDLGLGDLVALAAGDRVDAAVRVAAGF